MSLWHQKKKHKETTKKENKTCCTKLGAIKLIHTAGSYSSQQNYITEWGNLFGLSVAKTFAQQRKYQIKIKTGKKEKLAQGRQGPTSGEGPSFCCLSSVHLCSPLWNPLHKPGQSKHTYMHIYSRVCVSVKGGAGGGELSMWKQNKSSDLSALKHLPLTYALENGTMDAPQDAVAPVPLLLAHFPLSSNASANQTFARNWKAYVNRLRTM